MLGGLASCSAYTLRSDGELKPNNLPSMHLAGEMTYFADSARFTECLTDRSYAIAAGPEALKLERVYLKDVRSPGAPLYVSIEGTLTSRSGMEGDRLVPTLVVDRFINTWPNQACARAKADAAFANTYWRIVVMRDETVQVVSDQREPHVLLSSADDQHRYAATVGCNKLSGSFELHGKQLVFNGGVSTMMACQPPLDVMERRLVELLGSVYRWHIQGNTLELRDESGKSLALFEAVYF